MEAVLIKSYSYFLSFSIIPYHVLVNVLLLIGPFNNEKVKVASIKYSTIVKHCQTPLACLLIAMQILAGAGEILFAESVRIISILTHSGFK